MAEVPYSGGVPTTAAKEAVPDSYHRIQASPESFGAPMARAMNQFGTGALQAGTFFGRVAADDAANNFQERVNKILHGDPEKNTMGPDGKMVPDLGYLALKGQNALNARLETEKQIDNLMKETRKGLQTPQQQAEFDNISRRYRTFTSGKIGSHADSQANVWYQNVNTATAKVSLDHLVANIDNPTEVARATGDLVNAYVKGAELLGAQPGDEQWNEAVARGKRDAMRVQTQTIAVKDPVRAAAMVEANKAILGPLYDDLANHFRARADQQTGETGAARALSVPGPRAGVFTQPVEDAISEAAQATGMDVNMLRRYAMIESGGKPDAVKGSYRGLFQMSQTEFQKYRPGGNIFDPRDNAIAAAEKIKVEQAEFQQKYGRPATPADMYLIHQQGAGGYAAHMANPDGLAWQNMASTAEGRAKGEKWAKLAIWGNVPDNMKAKFGSVENITSADFVGLWAAKVNGAPMMISEATKEARKASAMQVLLADPALVNNQRAMDRAVHVVNQRLTAETIAEERTAKLKKDASDAAASNYVTEMLKGNYNGIVDRIANDPDLDWHAKKALGDAAQRKNGEDITEASQTYGPGFWSAYKAVTAQSTDPSRINDPTQLLGRAGPGGDLTLAGVEKLMGVMNQNKKGVDAQTLNTSKAGLMNYAKSKLSFEQDTGPIKLRDPKGEAIFNAQFIPKFMAGYDEWLKAGKNPWEYLSQENVDKMIVGMRNPAQMRMERMAATGESTAEDKKKAETLPPVPEGVDAQGWRAVLLTPPVTKGGKQWPLETWQSVIEELRRDPSPEAIKEFNQEIGSKTGIPAEKILQTLKGSKGAAAPQAPAGPSTMRRISDAINPVTLGGRLLDTVREDIKRRESAREGQKVVGAP